MCNCLYVAIEVKLEGRKVMSLVTLFDTDKKYLKVFFLRY